MKIQSLLRPQPRLSEKEKQEVALALYTFQNVHGRILNSKRSERLCFGAGVDDLPLWWCL